MASPTVRAILSLPVRRGGPVGAAAALGFSMCLLTVVALALPKTAYACSCAPPGSPAEALAEADAVFAGKVTAIRPLGQPPFRLSSADPAAVEFQISRVWKGPRREIATIETELSEISCGYEFKKGNTYIVYARGGRTGLCSRTSPAWRAFEDLVALGPGQEPVNLPDAKVSGGACARPASTGAKPMDIASVSLLAVVVTLGIRRRPRL